MITKCWCWQHLLSKIQELHYIKILSFRFSNNFIIICLTCTHLSHPLVQNAKIWVFYLTWLVQLHCTGWPTQLVVLWAFMELCMLISIFCPKAFVFQLWRLNTRKVFIWHLNFLAKFWWQELLNFLFEWGEHSSVTFCPDTTILKFWIKKFMYIGERRYLNACKQWRGINCSCWNLHCNSLLQ